MIACRCPSSPALGLTLCRQDWTSLLAILVGLLLLRPDSLQAQPAAGGTVTGVIFDRTSNQPCESVTVTLKKAADGTPVQIAMTARDGRFTQENIPAGDYKIDYGYLGSDSIETKPFVVAAGSRALDLGRLEFGGVLQMEKLVVRDRQREFYNTIDRKVYSVGREIQSATGTASDLLQNIPSVQVDIDGNVSLRGSDSVLILINGRTSTLMGKSRGEVLQQLPADIIDKIEVITNPSAKYKPDGTAGIINITLKKKQEGRTSASTSFSAGNEDRYNAGVTASYNPGRVTLFGGYSLKQDDRERSGTDTRTITNPATGAVTRVEKQSNQTGRPLSNVVRFGFTHSPDEHNQWGVNGNFYHRTYTRKALTSTRVSDGSGAVLQDYDRRQFEPDYEQSVEGAVTYLHKFAEEDHELNAEFKASHSREREPSYYTNVFRVPAQPATADNHLANALDEGKELVVEYVRPLSKVAKLEAGYTFSDERLDTELIAENLNPVSGLWERNFLQSNRFSHAEKIHAGYVTYARTIGTFGYLAGLRAEQAGVHSQLITTGQNVPNDYFKVYPSLHLSYRLNDAHELQLNYSHRVRRPESEELNPFIDYSDPFNLRAGNPRLRPEETHSLEAGYQFRRDHLSFLATIYHRARYHAFTNVTHDQGNGVLLSTQENLGRSDSTGLEIAATADVTSTLSVNFSSNTYFNQLDASNLGFSSSKSKISWSAKLSANLHLTEGTLVQFNTSYTSSQLTPQGSRLPSYIANLGLRHEFYQKKLAAVLTISDLFDSFQERGRLDTAGLQGENTRRRSPRTVYAGLTYYFGRQSKDTKDDTLKFEDTAGGG